MTPDVVLQLSDLQASYGESRILHGVSLECRRGQITAILGRNGVGKSTTLKCVMGLVPPRGGSVTYLGRQVGGLAPYQLSRLGIGFVPEERHVFPTLTVLENLQIGCRARPRADTSTRWSIDDVLRLFPGLQRRVRSQGQMLSGGEQQMLSIGRALVGNPDLILIDDPSEGLAPVIVEVVEDVIRQIAARGIAVLLVESKLPMVERLSNIVYVMSKGTVVYGGDAASLRSDVALRKKYLEV